MKVRWILAAIVAITLLAAASYSLLRTSPTPEGSVRVSALFTLEGDWRPYGEAYERGVRLALDKLRELGVDVELYRPQSYTGDKEVALVRLRELHEIGGVNIFVGLISSSAIKHCSEYIDRHRLFLIDGAATRTSLGEHEAFLRTIPPDSAAAKAIVDWAAETGARRGVIISFRDEWSLGLRADYERACRDSGIEIVSTIELDGNDRSPAALRAAADGIRNADPDFVMLAILGEDVAMLLRNLPTSNRPAIYGTDNLIGSFMELAGSLGQGVRFVVEDRAEPTDDFKERFSRAYPSEGLHLFTQTAYDATLAAGLAAHSTGGDPAAMRGWLESNEIEYGANGPFRVGRDDPSSHIFERREFHMDANKLVSRTVE